MPNSKILLISKSSNLINFVKNSASFFTVEIIDYFTQDVINKSKNCIIILDKEFQGEKIIQALQVNKIPSRKIIFIFNCELNYDFIKDTNSKNQYFFLKEPFYEIELTAIINNHLIHSEVLDYSTIVKDIASKNFEKSFYLAEFSDIGIILMNGNKVQFVNKIFKEMYGVLNSKIEYLDFNKILNIEENESLINPQKFVASMINCSGNKLYVQVNKIQIDDNDNSLFLYFFHDITDYIKIENELKTQGHKLELVLQSLPIGMIIVEYETDEITDCNPAFLMMLGAFSNQVLGRPVADFISKKNISNTFVPDKDIENEEEWELNKINNKKLPIIIKQEFVELDDATYMIISVQDITKLKEAEKTKYEKERLCGVLEMAGTIGHEFHQPMQIIQGLTELMLMTRPENSKDTKKLNKILLQLDRISKISKQISQITKYKTEKYTENSQIINLSESIE